MPSLTIEKKYVSKYNKLLDNFEKYRKQIKILCWLISKLIIKWRKLRKRNA